MVCVNFCLRNIHTRSNLGSMARTRVNRPNRKRGPKPKDKPTPKPKIRPKAKPRANGEKPVPKGKAKAKAPAIFLEDGLDEYMDDDVWFRDQGEQLVASPDWDQCEYCNMAWQYHNVLFLLSCCWFIEKFPWVV